MLPASPYSRSSELTSWLRLALLIAAPAVLVFIPFSTLATGPDLCLFKILFHRECWGCGMTRAFWYVLHGDVRQALAMNWRVALVFPIVTWAAAKTVLADLRVLRQPAAALRTNPSPESNS
jgi:hypothetical protein